MSIKILTSYQFLKVLALMLGLFAVSSSVSALVFDNQSGATISLTIKECTDPPIVTHVKDGKSYECVAGTLCKGTCSFAAGNAYTYNYPASCTDKIDAAGTVQIESGLKCSKK